MLELAVKARLPLIRVETDDPVNIADVLSAISHVPVKLGTIRNFKDIQKHSVSYIFGDIQTDWSAIYTAYAKKPATLIVIGGPTHSAFFDAGFVTAPKKMIKQFVSKYAMAKEAGRIVNALAGLSLKQAKEISMMAMTGGDYTGQSVQTIRRQFFGAIRGLELVRTQELLYDPPEQLLNWLAIDGQFVKLDVPDLIRPRGLLFTGNPGTGKTMGAKYVAEHLKLPMYRLDIGIVMSKWAGESEKNLHRALRQAENCAPCIVLLDEVEKLFVGAEEGGVNTRLLASLLWWLQEHQEAVFTIMTTNKQKLIPPELIRPGRIDQILYFPLLSYIADAPNSSVAFAIYLMDAITDVCVLHSEARMRVFKAIQKEHLSHADVTRIILGVVKEIILDKANQVS